MRNRFFETLPPSLLHEVVGVKTRVQQPETVPPSLIFNTFRFVINDAYRIMDEAGKNRDIFIF